LRWLRERAPAAEVPILAAVAAFLIQITKS
jgi:hypothetical protein